MFRSFTKLRLAQPARAFATQAAPKKEPKQGFSLRKNPYVPYLVLLSLVSSAVLKVLSKQQENSLLIHRSDARRSALNDIYDELKSTEDITKLSFYDSTQQGHINLVDRIEELTSKKDLDRSLADIMAAIESAEDEWIETEPGNEPEAVNNNSQVNQDSQADYATSSQPANTDISNVSSQPQPKKVSKFL